MPLDRTTRATTTPFTDAELVERARVGDERAFEQLVRRHLPVAHAVARSQLGGSDDDADDICQDAFLSALERIESCRHPDRFRAWLLTIVRNKAHNHRAYARVRRATPLHEAFGVASGEDTANRVESSEFDDELQKALGELTALQRGVFVRFDLEGWSHREIAAELGISEGSSRFHLHAARQALRGPLSAHSMARSSG